MKWFFVLIFSAMSSSTWADYCQCEVYAVAPLSASQKVEEHQIAQFRGKFYGFLAQSTIKECRSDCADLAQRDYDEETLKEKLAPWVDELVSYNLAGYNCTGPTSFKVPVRVRATLSNRRLGISRQSMIFLHRHRNCFI